MVGNKFGARAYAENFTEEELISCIQMGRSSTRQKSIADGAN